MAKSKIEWTDQTWNPTTGCRKVSAGCDNCYAATLAARLKRMGNPRYQKDGPDGPGFGLTLHRDKIEDPLHWKKPRQIFVNSMSDLFHKDVPIEFIRRVFDVMEECDRHIFQVLTKRPRGMAKILKQFYPGRKRAPKHIWLGTSIESDAFTWRADELRKVPARTRFLSVEPLIGPVPSLKIHRIHWVIVGGESGKGARLMDRQWARDIRDLCKSKTVPFFFKQWGKKTNNPNPKDPTISTAKGGRRLDGRTWNQYPA